LSLLDLGEGKSARYAESSLARFSLRLLWSLPPCVRVTEGQALCAQQVLDGVRDFERQHRGESWEDDVAWMERSY
jgi:hypothetical protein